VKKTIRRRAGWISDTWDTRRSAAVLDQNRKEMKTARSIGRLSGERYTADIGQRLPIGGSNISATAIFLIYEIQLCKTNCCFDVVHVVLESDFGHIVVPVVRRSRRSSVSILVDAKPPKSSQPRIVIG
jgi:hypothetical protein